MLRARILLLSFLAGACGMTAELLAPRLVAPHLGTSALTWVATIATFLSGAALGNAVGGRLADRSPRGYLIPALFAAAAVLLGLAPLLDPILAERLRSLSHPLRVLVVVPLEFGGAAVALGAVAPALARAVLRADAHPGRALGLVAAAGAAGSVVGTFLAGFAWIPNHGTRAILTVTALVPAACALAAGGIGTTGKGDAVPPPRDARPLASAGVLAVLAGAALLAFEVAIGRVAAERLGSSVFTWTSVIGVVLLGLAAGNAVGGRLADRYAPRPLLGALLLVASAALAVSIWTPMVLRPVLALDGLSYALRCLLGVSIAFFLPAAALGTLGPAVVRAALAEPETDGRTAGRLYAAGSLGAVVGTALTGFVLVPWLGIPALLALLALVVAVAAGLVRRRVEVPWLLLLVGVALLALLPAPFARREGARLFLREDAPGTWVTDSRYMHIRVNPMEWRWARLVGVPAPGLDRDPALGDRVAHDEERNTLYWKGPMSDAEEAAIRSYLREDEDRDALSALRARTGHRIRRLTLDRIDHGYVDLDDPTWLGYDYEAVYFGATERLWPKRTGPVRAFFVGAGPFGIQRRLRASHGASLVSITAEIDPEVARAGREALGLEDDVTEVALEDARTWVRGLPSDAPPFDFVFGDAFNDLSVPWHLTTVEFTREVKVHLTPDGVYLVNMVDSFASGRFLGAFLRTLESEFRHVLLFSAPPRREDAQDTFVLIATDREIDLTGLPSAVAYGPVDLAALRSRPGPALLTDDHAPVEALLAPVVADRDTR